MAFFRRGRKSRNQAVAQHQEGSIEKNELHKETRTRKFWSLASAFFLLISVIFLILVEVASTSKSRLSNVWFVKLDLTNIIPASVPNSGLINTIAQTLGLHDFYQVGLWNYCAGYNDQGITYCSKPQTLYWFNPIEIISSELVSGASITLPQEVVSILHILKTASQWMFGLFLTAACLDFVMIFLTPLSLFSKLVSIPITILTFLAALCTTVATVLGTVIFIILRNAATSQTAINIGAKVGTEMFAFMWVAAAFSLFALVIQLSLCCCCRSRRKAKKEFRKSHMDGDRALSESEKESAT